MERTTRIDLPSYVERPFEVFVNGVPQVEGTDFEQVGSSLVFSRRLVREGSLGTWRWLRMLLGVAGTYRQNDSIDVIFQHNGQRRVVPLAAPMADAEED